MKENYSKSLKTVMQYPNVLNKGHMMQSVDGRNLRDLVRHAEYSIDSKMGEGGRSPDRQGLGGVDVRPMVYDAYGRADHLHRESMEVQDFPEMTEGDMQSPEDDTDFDNLLRNCVEPVYQGCTENRLQCGIVLMTLASVYGVSDNFVTALLGYLAGTLLPRFNSLPRTAYELKTMIRKLGLEHQRIDTCPDGHILFDGEVDGALQHCPVCNRRRYIPGSNTVPCAVTRYFPIIPKMKRLYKCPRIAELLEHYAKSEFDGQIMRSVADSFQWQEISRMYPGFRDVATHLRLALIADGVCPHGNQNSKHSTWIVFIAVYNFPGWLATKKFFLNLALLIPRPKAPTSDTIDVYLKPLVKDLLQLWYGVPALNMSKPVNERHFTLRAILMWTVNDFPALGLLSGQTVKGYIACPVCGENTCSEHSSALSKMVYLGGRQFLNRGHRFRRARAAFNNFPEHRVAPDRRTGATILEQGRERAEWLRRGGVEDSEGDPVKRHGVKRASIMFALPY